MSFLDWLLNQAKSSSQMSDRELQNKLNRGVGKNTGEDIATRASYVRAGLNRGITADQDKKNK